MLAVTRLVVESGVSVVKVPLVLTQASLYLNGNATIHDIVSSTTVDRYLTKAFMFDAAILREDFKDVRSLHIQPDISGKQG